VTFQCLISASFRYIDARASSCHAPQGSSSMIRSTASSLFRRVPLAAFFSGCVALAACFGSSEGAMQTGTDTPGDDAGEPACDDAAGCDPATNPYDTPLTCTSNTHWTRGDRGSASMHPGGTCISCHKTTGPEAPTFSIGGTVFPSAHEPNDCNGKSGVSVVITDANGKTRTLTTNAVGNFNDTAALAVPYHAKVVANGKERAMSAAQTTGDCNSCHTVTGANGAPGRIMAP
jgi:hypothetical protein